MYHKLRHGFMSKDLGFSTERHAGKSYIHWYCKKTGDVLDTVELGRTTPSGTDPVGGSTSGDPE